MDECPAPLDAVEAAFRRACTSPRCPLALNPARLAAGLPDRMMRLDELRVLLLHPATGSAARNQVWAGLVRRARTAGPDWMLGLTGVALPGLRRAARLASASPAGLDDVQQEVLAGFTAAVAALDLGRLGTVPLASSLTWAAYRAAAGLARTETDWAAARTSLGDLDETAMPASPGRRELPWDHPGQMLEAAVTAGVLTREQADLIAATRLHGVPLKRFATRAGISHAAMGNRRIRAEKTLTAALLSGRFPAGA